MGLTDRWDATVCLWHKMFRGQIVPTDLAHLRAGDVTLKKGDFPNYADRGDDAVWREGRLWFARAVARYWRCPAATPEARRTTTCASSKVLPAACMPLAVTVKGADVSLAAIEECARAL